MVATIETAGVELAYSQQGSGQALLLVHGLGERAADWEPVADRLAAVARVIAYDRRGYGGSSAPEPYEGTTVAEQAHDAAALLEALDGAPAVVCGRDLGALVCLELVRNHRSLVRAAAVVDPPLFAFSALAEDALVAQRVELGEALHVSGPAGAVEAWLRTRGASPQRIERGRADHAAFFADLGGLASWPITRRELRAFEVPLAVLVSADAPAHVRDGAGALASLVPGAITADASQLADVLDRFVGDPNVA